MARNDFLTLKTRVLDELHDSSLLAKVGDFVLETIDDINSRGNHRFLRTNGILTTVASQQEYTISVDIGSDVDFIVAITSRGPNIYFAEMTKQDLLKLNPNPTNVESNPWAYYVQNDTIGFFPVPASADNIYYVEYIKFDSNMIADGDTPSMPLRWVRVIIDGAVARGLKYQRPTNPSVWTPQFNLYELQLARMLTLNQRKPNKRIRMSAQGDHVNTPVAPRIELWKS